MASEVVLKRPRREAAKNKIYTAETVLKCNPANFVGYVEDLETPEMISKSKLKVFLSKEVCPS